jgi:hypothetical protein
MALLLLVIAVSGTVLSICFVALYFLNGVVDETDLKQNHAGDNNPPASVSVH